MHPLKQEEELLTALKAKLTKKELKLLKAWSEGTSVEDIQSKLNLDETHYGELSAKLIKKLNQEKTKQAISTSSQSILSLFALSCLRGSIRLIIDSRTKLFQRIKNVNQQKPLEKRKEKDQKDHQKRVREQI